MPPYRIFMTDLAHRLTAASRRDAARLKPSSAPTSSTDFPGSHHFEDHPLSWNSLLEALPDGTALLDDAGVMHYVNQRLARMTGYTRDDLVGQNVMMLVPHRLRNLEEIARTEHSKDPDTPIIWSDQELFALRKDGSELSVDFALSSLTLNDQTWALGAIRDNSVGRAVERARADVELRFRVAFEKNMAPMTFTDIDDRIVAVNDAFCDMVGYTEEELLGRDSTIFTLPEDVGITEETQRRAIAGEAPQERYEKRYLTKDGRVIDVEVSRTPARDAGGRILYFVFSERDITEEKALTAQLSHQALHDPLTGLANRLLFEDRLTHAHARVVRHGGMGAVLLLDLDDFKGVNDTHGHFVGDQLLTAIAHRLAQATRASDTLCRFGGDEFLYLAEGLASIAEAEELAARLLEVISEPFSVGGFHIEQHASIGIVVWDRTSADSTEIIQNVDAALYEAKHHGRGRHIIFTPEMHHQAVSRFTLTQELRHALHTGQISMHYQPIAELNTNEVVGFEALMRWEHPERGWVPPSEFIPLAEQSDLILELGSFALRESIMEAASWVREGSTLRPPYVTVNLSAPQFLDPGLVPMITTMLAGTGLAPTHLILEITESVALHDIYETMIVINQLNRLGVGIALDDFGTGFSSLSYLAELSPRIIKIDQSFVRPKNGTARDDTLLATIISLGQQLDMTMLAEGIETPGQFSRLLRLGCELGQGYLFSPAVPTDEVAAMVGQQLGN